MRCFEIGLLEFLSFLIVTINFRACAKGYIKITVGTDILLATFGFTLTQKIANATTWEEQACYVLGAACGSVLGMRITRSWDHDK